MLLVEKILLVDRQLDGSHWVAARSLPEQNRIAAAAVLIELAMLDRVHNLANQLAVRSDLPTQYSLLTDAQAVLSRKLVAIEDAPLHLHRAMPNIAKDVLDSMVRRGVMIAEKNTRLLFWSQTRYSVQSTSVYRACINTLAETAQQVGLGDLLNLGFLLLSDRLQLLPHLFASANKFIDGRLAVANRDWEKNLERFESIAINRQNTSDPQLACARLIFAFAHSCRDLNRS